MPSHPTLSNLSLEELEKRQNLCKNLPISQCPNTKKTVLEAVAATLAIIPGAESTSSRSFLQLTNNLHQRLKERLLRKQKYRKGRILYEGMVPLSHWIQTLMHILVEKLVGLTSSLKTKETTKKTNKLLCQDNQWCGCYFDEDIYKSFKKDQKMLASSLQIQIGDENSDRLHNKRSIPIGSWLYFKPRTCKWTLLETDEQNIGLDIADAKDSRIVIMPPQSLKNLHDRNQPSRA